MTRHQHDALREGIAAGLIGAVIVAAWFLLTDLLADRPFSTPSILGQVILYRDANPVVSPAQTGPVVAYTLLHFGVFVLFGVALTQLVHLAMSSPLARFGLMMLAVCFELFALFALYAVFHATRELFPWWSVLVANSLSLLSMGWYLKRGHPGLLRQYQKEALGA